MPPVISSTQTTTSSSPSLVDATVKRLLSLQGVQQVLILSNKDGVALRSTMGTEATFQHATLLAGLCQQARSVVAALGQTEGSSGKKEEMTLLRLCSKAHEIIITPDKDYSLVVIRAVQRGGGGK